MLSGFNLNPGSAQQGTGMFGQQAQQQPQQQMSGFFGQQSQQPTATPGLFGQQSTQTPGLFGQQSTQQPATSNIFGQQTPGMFSQQGQQAPQTTNIFGQQSSQTPNVMNQPRPLQMQSPFSFAPPQQQQQQQQQYTPSLFAPATPSFSLQQQQPQQQQPAPVLPDVLQYVQAIQAAYDPSHPQCRFRHFLYNLVHPNDMLNYRKPENVDDVLWQQAMANSPDASCMVPVQAVGFDDLLKRASQQDDLVTSFNNKLREMENQTASLQNKHQLENNTRIETLQRRHMALAQRVIQMMRRLQVLLHRGTSIHPQEESFRAKIEAFQREINRPRQYAAKLNGILTELHAIQAQMRLRPSMNESLNISKESEPLLEQVLAQQTKGLTNLGGLIQNSRQDIEIMLRGYSERPSLVQQ